MEDDLKKIVVFVASPGDVSAERSQIPKVVQEINLIISAIAPEKKIVLDLLRWETNIYPGMGADAQDVINQQLPDYDIFVGIMWKRFGTPTQRAESGTEEEFEKAYSKWKGNNKFPVLFYFCQNPSAPPRNTDEMEQLKKVVEFKESLSNKGLIWEYTDQTGFADVIRPHLILVLSRMFASNNADPVSSEKTRQLTTDNDISIAKTKVKTLADQYEELREKMPSGNDRTRQMAIIESSMRAIAMQIFPILPDLINSQSPGERLAAVATLKEIPDPKYLTWLSDRVGAEKPFIAYQSTLGLLTAARTLGAQYKTELLASIEAASKIIDNLKYKDPNQVKVLNDAKNILKTNK